MKKQLLLVMLCAGMFCGTEAQGQETERLSGYVQAERFTKEKLNTMLFSTSVDPHWFQKGNNFWYEYKTVQRRRRFSSSSDLCVCGLGSGAAVPDRAASQAPARHRHT